MNPTSIHITAVVVRWKTKTGREQKGVATTWLQTKKPISKFYNTFTQLGGHCNDDGDEHMVMVGMKIWL